MSDVPNDDGAVAAWDVPRDGPSPPPLSPAEWRARNDESLARKVAIIVAATRDLSRSTREKLPTDHRTLRAWRDPARRLWSWTGREVDDRRGRNKEIVAQLHEAWRALADADASLKAGPRRPGLRQQLAAALAREDALAAQLVNLMRQRNARGSIPEEDRH